MEVKDTSESCETYFSTLGYVLVLEVGLEYDSIFSHEFSQIMEYFMELVFFLVCKYIIGVEVCGLSEFLWFQKWIFIKSGGCKHWVNIFQKFAVIDSSWIIWNTILFLKNLELIFI